MSVEEQSKAVVRAYVDAFNRGEFTEIRGALAWVPMGRNF
jgi:hypothetical protein